MSGIAGVLPRYCRFAMLPVALAVLPATAPARHSAQHETADGLEVYIGLLPAPMVQKFPKGSEERRMHGGPGGRGQRYHLVTAIFDSATDQRVERADVRATVAPLGLGGADKRLEPMAVAGAASYGQYFDVPENGRYTVTVTVKRSDQAAPVTARFTVLIE